jgi:hypothetical protein
VPYQWRAVPCRCRTCGAYLFGRAPSLDAITGERRAGCGCQVQVMTVRICSQPGSGGCSMTRDQWRLARQIDAILAAESGAADAEVAERTDATLADVRTAARVRYRMRRADFIWCTVVAISQLTRGGGAA